MQYDVAIIGGGLAGLAAAIQLAKKGHSIVLFEKESFPFHKVCGEYISMESWNFLEDLGVPLQEMKLPKITQLQLTAPDGNSFKTTLPLGGFGVSRYRLDAVLAALAKKHGVTVLQKTKVENVVFNNQFFITYNSFEQTSEQVINSRVCCAAYGKRSNLDVKWKRPFLLADHHRLNNYVGIKYHVKTTGQKGLIGLHNFEDGYCGISEIEEGNYCLCYMTKAENLKKYKGNIAAMETEVLHKNPHLKNILTHCAIVAHFPIVISQINFSKKACVENKVLMLGDAAGTIPPLCGNGMSMALHSSKLAAHSITAFLTGALQREEMEKNYTNDWNKTFGNRLKAGRIIQGFFGKTTPTNLFVSLFKKIPFLASGVIKLTHGKPF